ncbi:CxC2 domain-containing protein [Mycena chlorophos]|uniref:CxC2 domain-containing protein n=1 Tax=Mycena chlorophos TaxID=658473 RepID=A0A8H6WAV7_MYCCL|nr:CxC2 domain-containing protein [Mycena chlorophos]
MRVTRAGREWGAFLEDVSVEQLAQRHAEALQEDSDDGSDGEEVAAGASSSSQAARAIVSPPALPLSPPLPRDASVSALAPAAVDRQRARRRGKRHRERAEAGPYKAFAARRTAAAEHTRLDFAVDSSIAQEPLAKRGYVTLCDAVLNSRRVQEAKSQSIPALLLPRCEESSFMKLVSKGFSFDDWDGYTTHYLVLGGEMLSTSAQPSSKKPQEHCTTTPGPCFQGVQHPARSHRWTPGVMPGKPNFCRGSHRSATVGVGMGGGRTVPTNFDPKGRYQRCDPSGFGVNVCGQADGRLCKWYVLRCGLEAAFGSRKASAMLRELVPWLYRYYEEIIDALFTRMPHLRRLFASVLAAFTFNFGPRTATRAHLDLANLAWGWCFITALGWFDPDLGGHLVLWDIKRIIRFPPGSSIGIPSAFMRHSNTRVQQHETRYSFTQFSAGGIHQVAVDYCGCRSGEFPEPHFSQLLRAGFYPSTTGSPRTCITIECLERVHGVLLSGKITPYHFYQALETLTDATGVKPPDRYQVFLRMMRQYWHLLALKRGGRGHDSGGVMATQPGQLAIRCPACPRPGVNLPEGWENAPLWKATCIYNLSLAFDGCFRLKRRDISNEFKDPPLGPGWSYTVEPKPYKEYLLTQRDQKEVSGCTGLRTISQANTKFSRGYAATGVVMGVCARHEFVQPTGVADLQAGERFANVDWILAAILRHLSIRLRKILSYDVACQWWKHLFERLKRLPPLMRLGIILELKAFLAQFAFVVPKLHILGHTALCQLLYSLNFVLGGGQTDGEGIERPSDDHWAFWNWSKTIKIDDLDHAKEEQTKQRQSFKRFSQQQVSRAPVWKAMVLAYEKDTLNNPNPYQATSKGKSELQGRARIRVGQVGPAEFIIELLDLENEQRRVSGLAVLKKAKSTSMKINIRSLRRAVNRRLEVLRQLQTTYMPASLQRLRAANLPESTLVEDVPLFAPSALSASERAGGGCVDGLWEMENKLRDAQCRTALVALRHQLLLKWRMLRFLNEQAHGQAMTTRSLSNAARNKSKILLHSKKYQMAWQALVSMAEGDEKAITWPRLRKDDIRAQRSTRKFRAAGETTLTMARPRQGPEDEDDVFRAPAAASSSRGSAGTVLHHGESSRTVSWIWTMAGNSGTDVELEEAIRIEWTKAWARVRRWDEEVRIATDEQRRVVESFEYESRVWMRRAAAVPLGTLPRRSKPRRARAEITRTEAKLKRGQKRPRYDPLQVTFEEALGSARSGESRSPEVPATTPEPTTPLVDLDGSREDASMDCDTALEDEEADGLIEPEELDEQGNVSDEELEADIDDW